MHQPRACTHLEQSIAGHSPPLRPAQQRGLTLGVHGAVLAQKACQNAVVAALLTLGHWHALRQRLREWLYDGGDKAAPCQAQVDVTPCFAPLLRWVLSWWRGDSLPLAIDATLHGDRVTALVVSVLYRGSAIPVAWHILPANQEGAWMSPILRLLRHLSPAVPSGMTVLVLADRGLWSPRLWKRIRDLGWHPLLRVQHAEATLGRADRSAACTGRRVLVRLACLGGVGLQGLERAWVAVAAHAADGPDARESPLVSPGGRDPVGHGLWHARRGRGRLWPAPWTASHAAPTTHTEARHQCLSSRRALAAVPDGARTPLAPALACAGTVADHAHIPHHHGTCAPVATAKWPYLPL